MASSKKTSDIRIAGTRASGRDCLIHQDSADDFLMGLARHEATSQDEHESLSQQVWNAVELAYGCDSEMPDEAARKPFVYRDGIAVIPVHGTLINRFNNCWGFVTGYNYIRRQINLAAFDDDVEVIVLDIDSPGGEAAGNFELAREIMEIRDDKPILAVVDSRCMSGGYAIASACTQIVAIPSAAVGSIGVYRMHMDMSGMLEKQGVKVTFAKAGDHKVDGNPFEPLSPEVLRDWNESAGKTWDDFIQLVAAGRGISEDRVRSTQAKVYRSDEALALGLIDAVKTPSEAIAAFIAELSEDEPFSNEEDEMALKPTTTSEATSETPAAPAVSQAQIAEAAAAAVAADRKAQRERRVKVMASDEAKASPKMAHAMIENTDLDADMIIATLAEGVESTSTNAAPEGDQQAPAPKGDNTNHLDNAMNNSRQPNVGAGVEADGDGGDKEPTDKELAATILADAGFVTGRDFGLKDKQPAA